MADLILGRNAVLEALKSGRNIDKISIQKTDGQHSGTVKQIIATQIGRASCRERV